MRCQCGGAIAASQPGTVQLSRGTQQQAGAQVARQVLAPGGVADRGQQRLKALPLLLPRRRAEQAAAANAAICTAANCGCTAICTCCCWCCLVEDSLQWQAVEVHTALATLAILCRSRRHAGYARRLLLWGQAQGSGLIDVNDVQREGHLRRGETGWTQQAGCKEERCRPAACR